MGAACSQRGCMPARNSAIVIVARPSDLYPWGQWRFRCAYEDPTTAVYQRRVDGYRMKHKDVSSQGELVEG